MKFKIMCEKGDNEFDYADSQIAEIKFNELMESNLLPVVATPQGKKALVKFDPKAEEILWMAKIAGG